jgi:uncharacterized protein
LISRAKRNASWSPVRRSWTCRFGGDSLQGRYFYLRLHPFSVAELGGHANAPPALLALTLPERVGSPLSLNALGEDLQVSQPTVALWVDVPEGVYGIFRLPPFGTPRLRAVQKERKHYHCDWSVVSNPGARFENLIACHLLKWVKYQVDTQGCALELRYFRDIDGREVDFVIVEAGRTPLAFVECKLGDDAPGSGLKFLKARFPDAAAWQVSAHGVRDCQSAEGIRVAPAHKLLRDLV